MRPTQTLLGQKAREAVMRGVSAIYEPVRRTLGPQGKNALLYRTFNRGSRITNDGYTIAECQEPKDPFVRLVAAAFKEACKRTNERVGDGTTTTTVIGGKLMQNCYALLTESATAIGSSSAGIGVMTLKKRIMETAEKVKKQINEVAVKVATLEDLEKIAIVSVEDIDLGKTIAKMAFEVGVDGFIDTVEGYKQEIETEIIKGFRFPAKVPGKGFVNNPAKYEMVAEDCQVLITNYALDNVQQLSDAINPIIDKNPKLIIIAPSFSDSVLTSIHKANFTRLPNGQSVKGASDIFPVNTPSLRTDQFEDLAVYTGATFIDKNKGKLIASLKPSDMGFLEKLIVKDTENREDAIATGGKGEHEVLIPEMGKAVDPATNKEHKTVTERKTTQIAERIEVLKGQLKETHQESFKKLLERRIASMSSAVGIIRVGDSTQASSLYRKLKIEDAVYACKAALRGGYVKGGGICLKEIAEGLPESDILRSALEAPYAQIQASVEGGLEIGPHIIDPAEVVFFAVEHAVGVVANLMTVEIITPELEDTQPGDGYMAIAKMIGEHVLSNKRHLGQITENEEEAERDRLGGLTVDEHVALSRD